MLTIGLAVSTSDNNQVKPPGKVKTSTKFIQIYYIYIYIYIYAYIYVYTYIYTYNLLYICNEHSCYTIVCPFIHSFIYIYICISNRIYPYTIIYSYTVNVNLILIRTELSEWMIYCKYAWNLSVFEVIYYICLYYTFLSIHFPLTYKRYER